MDSSNLGEKYMSHSLKKVHHNFVGLNEIDMLMINNYLNSYKGDLNIKELTSNLYKKSLELIRKYTYKAEKMTVAISKHETQDVINSKVSFKYKTFYISPLTNFNYLRKPNSFEFKTNFIVFNSLSNPEKSDQTITSFFHKYVLEHEVSCGFNFKFNNLEKTLYVQSNLMIKDDYEAGFLCSTARAYKDSNRRQTYIKNRIYLAKSFNSRPFLFRGYPEFDVTNKLTLNFGHKLLNNYIDCTASSKQLVAGTPDQDSLKFFSIIYNLSSFNLQNSNLFSSELTSDIICSLKFNHTLNSKYLVSKLFLRKMFKVNSYLLWQLNMEAKNAVPLERKLLKSHETLTVNDFKGVVSPGPKFSNGDCLGMLNTLKLYNKIYFTSISLLNNGSTLYKEGTQVLPFFHLNFLYHYGNQVQFYKKVLPDSSINLTLIDERDKNSNLYVSAGLGLSYISSFVCFEVYYNAFVKKNKHDIGSEFGFNIGID